MEGGIIEEEEDTSYSPGFGLGTFSRHVLAVNDRELCPIEIEWIN